MINKKYLIDFCRETMNHTNGYFLSSDFEGWCEGMSALIAYAAINLFNFSGDIKIVYGTFDGKGHTWCELDGEIVDGSVDQFGDDYSIYSCRLYSDKYSKESVVNVSELNELIWDSDIDYMNHNFNLYKTA